MKKRGIVLIICMVIVLISLLIPSIIQEWIPTARATKVKEIEYVGYVTATGEIKQSGKQEIVTEIPIIVSQVFVRSGQPVKVGDPIVSINREKTAEKIMELSNISSMTGLTTGVFAMSYEDALDKIPNQIVSDYNGVIQSVNALDGVYIQKDSVIASLISDGDLEVNVQVPESRIYNVKIGQPVEITGSGFENRKYYGYVESISTTARKVYIGANQETVVDVVVSIDDLDDKIKAGYSAKARIIIENKKSINIIPYESVMQDKSGNEFVYVFLNGLAIRKDIETGLELGEGVQVVSGINQKKLLYHLLKK